MNPERVLENALSVLGRELPADEHICLYRSGLLDSADLIQLILEIELETGIRLELGELFAHEISPARIKAALAQESK